MAIAAVNAQSADMVLVAEKYRLRPRHPGISDVRRTLELDARPQHHSNNEYSAKDRCSCDCVRAAVKNLHRSRRPTHRRGMARPSPRAFVPDHKIL